MKIHMEILMDNLPNRMNQGVQKGWAGYITAPPAYQDLLHPTQTKWVIVTSKPGNNDVGDP